MSQPPKPRGLGRGLSALLGDEDVAASVATSAEPKPEAARPSARAPLTLPISQLRPGKMQPRTAFEGLNVLVESIREHGLLQPILVRRIPSSVYEIYEIVAGERRWRAAQQAQLHEVPVVVRDLDDREALQLGLVENLQRTDLTPMDEAKGYRRLVDQFRQTQEDIARTIGKSRPHVANILRLLDLPDAVQAQVHQGFLSAGHARALVGMPETEAVALARRAVDEKLSVRQLEQIAQQAKAPSAAAGHLPRKAGEDSKSKTADTRALEKRIEEALGVKADLKLRGLGEQCLLTLQIRDFDQLDTVVERLTRR